MSSQHKTLSNQLLLLQNPLVLILNITFIQLDSFAQRSLEFTAPGLNPPAVSSLNNKRASLNVIQHNNCTFACILHIPSPFIKHKQIPSVQFTYSLMAAPHSPRLIEKKVQFHHKYHTESLHFTYTASV